MYILIIMGGEATRACEVEGPKVPEDLVGPGEIGFVIEALDVKANFNKGGG